MSRFEVWTVHVSVLLVGGTGLAYAWMLYFLEPTDPFSIVHHPMQPQVQHAHVWFAPLLVFAAGLIWREHIWKHWKQGVRSGRRSGLALLLTLAPMVASGYLIQTAVSAGWRSAWVTVHLVASGLWVVGYGLHVWTRIRRARKTRRARLQKERGLPKVAVNPS